VLGHWILLDALKFANFPVSVSYFECEYAQKMSDEGNIGWLMEVAE